eukprot:6175939-Pleurochrysis_carterae.AAC.4
MLGMDAFAREGEGGQGEEKGSHRVNGLDQRDAQRNVVINQASQLRSDQSTSPCTSAPLAPFFQVSRAPITGFTKFSNGCGTVGEKRIDTSTKCT